MGSLPESAIEVRLAATLFLLLLGLANFFGAWQVKNFAAFTPRGVAGSVAPSEPMTMNGPHMRRMPYIHVMEMPATETPPLGMEERPIDISSLNQPHHQISRELLVQDTHVHVPVYAMTAAFLSLILFGLRLSSGTRVFLVLLAFAAPVADFAGLWGAHLFPARGAFWGGVAIAGGFLMGLVYLIVLALTLSQCWLGRKKDYNV